MSFFDNELNPPFQLPLTTDLLTPLVQSTTTAELTDFVTSQAMQLAEDIGFSWVAAPVEQPTCRELMHLMAVAATKHEALEVSSYLADMTLLLNPHAELALRYWRAVTKFQQRDCHCDVASELRCDIALVDQAALAEVSQTAQMYLYGDLIGTTLLRTSGYGMSIAPREYILDVLMFGLPEAILMEIERREDARRGLDFAA